MKSSTNKMPLGQIQDIFTVISKEDFILQNNFIKGSVYAIENTDSGYLAISDTQTQRIWGEWEYTPFTMKINASDSSFTIPTSPLNQYNYIVDWGDGNVTDGHTGDAQHTYAVSGEYIVKIYGKFGSIFFINSGDKDKVLDILNWGGIKWGPSLNSSFQGCQNMVVSATDIPDFSGVNSLNSFMRSCSSLPSLDIRGWDFSNVRYMNLTFSGCNSLNEFYVEGIDTSNVETMSNAFQGVPATTIDVSSWNIEKVTNFGSNFLNAALPFETYDSILNSWAAQNVNQGLSVNFPNCKYSPAGQVGRDVLTNTYGWTITDDGPI